ncbi:MaoC/PaaZ C-terminal domain-containing protein [Flexivirga oryzae]|uniref:Acyl dehydratase n=1 Tax=Flexivirga oryzae TaxID=1794944 RepID=A0A839NEM0_9MICO|nr:MaoC/PaaZ C-terminal domain-containing protein [Flexivirga oryzae]MBB2894394.1 acyl dehydratase [Flexivirga oryzae]
MTEHMGSPADWYFEDFAAGQVFQTQGRTITEADIVTFAGWSWDTNPVHTDAVHSAAGRFGGPIAHGALGFSVALGLASRLGIFEQCSIALLGIDGWRFEHPIVAGDTVRCTVHITGVRATSNGKAGILERDFVLSNQGGTVVQRGSIGLMVARRPTGATARQPRA